MSADKWTSCKNCFDKAERLHQEFIDRENARLRELYGTVSPEKYLEAVEQSRQNERESEAAVADCAEDQTFRVDYEIFGEDEGFVGISYHGQCQVCGYGLAFNESHDLRKKGDW